MLVKGRGFVLMCVCVCTDEGWGEERDGGGHLPARGPCVRVEHPHPSRRCSCSVDSADPSPAPRMTEVLTYHGTKSGSNKPDRQSQ